MDKEPVHKINSLPKMETNDSEYVNQLLVAYQNSPPTSFPRFSVTYHNPLFNPKSN